MPNSPGKPPDDTDAAAHRWTGTGGGDAYLAWWRTQYPTADENTAGLTGQMYDVWKHWSDNGSDVRAMDGNEAELTTLKAGLTAFQNKMYANVNYVAVCKC